MESIGDVGGNIHGGPPYHPAHQQPNMHFDLDSREYGADAATASFVFQPKEYGILEKYAVKEELYRVMLSPTIITKVINKETNEVRRVGDGCSA